VVGVVPDVPALERVLDYLVPDGWVVDDGAAPEVGDEVAGRSGAPVVRLGSIVRIPLQGRRVRGWVVEIHRRPPEGVPLRPLAKVTGLGPSADLLELGEWAAWHWAGRRLTFLRAASPAQAVAAVPDRRVVRSPTVPIAAGPAAPGDLAAVSARALERAAVTVVRVPPAADVLPLVVAALGRGQALVLVPGRPEAAELAARLRREGVSTARPPGGWAAAAGGASVVGSRAAAWFPAPHLGAVVVLDEHDQRYQEERTPTWHARDVAVERARRAGVPCLLVSPTPSLEALALGRQLAPSRAEERRGWPTVEVVDRSRDDDPQRHGLYSPPLVAALRGGGRAVLVVNRTGRARLLACQQCRQLATCTNCGSALASTGATTGANGVGVGDGVDDGNREQLVCPRCGCAGPPGCTHCGSNRFRLLRPGVSRVREELEALLREPVGELTAAAASDDGPASTMPQERVVVGTEAALHRIHGPDLVAFPDLDAQLAAPRFRAASQVLYQLGLAARRLGGRRPGARLLLQTRLPGHPVVDAVLHADPTRAAHALAEQARRLRLPPFTALAELAGAGAVGLADRLARLGLDVSGPVEGRYLVRAADGAALADGLRAAGRGEAPVRIEIDPARI